MTHRPALLLLLSLTSPLLAAPPTTAPFRHNGITAHRGDQSAAPENTLQAFADAIAAGADWIELDIFTTRDGQIVVSHDPTTARAGDQNLTIADSTYDQLRQVDVATAFRKCTGQTLATCPKATMPLLSDAIALVQRHPDVRLSIQPKDGSTDRAVELVRKMNAVSQVGFNDSSLPKMRRVKELEPRLKVHWDRPAKFDLEADLATSRQYGFEAFIVHHSALTPELIRRAKANGLEVGAWTVNDPTAAAKFLAWGADRLYTDDPRTMLSLKRPTTTAPTQPARP